MKCFGCGKEMMIEKEEKDYVTFKCGCGAKVSVPTFMLRRKK